MSGLCLTDQYKIVYRSFCADINLFICILQANGKELEKLQFGLCARTVRRSVTVSASLTASEQRFCVTPTDSSIKLSSCSH